MRWRGPCAILVAVLASAAAAGGQELPVRPYADPNLLDVPWPKHSHYKQPWRAFLQTRSARGFLRGVGVAYNASGKDELALRLLAETGFRALRLEIGWGHLNWDETGFGGPKRLHTVLSACKQYGIRPTLLLNAHQGVPCPCRFFHKTLAADAPQGGRSVMLTDTAGLVAGRSGLSNLTTYWAAEALITRIDPNTGRCELSKPLPKALGKGSRVPMATLKYSPLYPVGHAEFDRTADGWCRYALKACELAARAGLDEWDVEIWNELTFGTKFLRINNYHRPPVAPPAGRRAPDFLRKGGTCWELARRTIRAVKAAHPKVRCIWGFSNTTFFHCPVSKLPPGTDGQSYHPYGTGTRSLPSREQHADRPELCLERFVPTVDIRMPEGWAQTFVQTESLMRLIHPGVRGTAPPGTRRFHHYITEHGTVPTEAGVVGEDAAWRYKTKCALRSFCLWLHKGIDVMHYFCAWSKGPEGMGLLPPTLRDLPDDARFDEVATPPMRAVRNLTHAFAGARPLGRPRPVTVDVVALGKPVKVLALGPNHPPLWQRELLAFLPFAVTDDTYVAAVYVMTYDATADMPPRRFRLTLRAPRATLSRCRLYDPVTGSAIPVTTRSLRSGACEVELPVVDYPRLLTIAR